MHRFYCNQIENDTAVLDITESNHCKNVLRVQDGQQVEITDGKGHLWVGVCRYPHAKSTIAEYLNPVEAPPAKNLLTIAVSPTKNPSRMEWFVEKATELGVQKIIPLQTQRTEKVYLKTERLHKLIVSAGKQSKSVHFPVLEELTTLEQYFQKFYKSENQNFIAHCMEGEEKKTLTLSDMKIPCHILIGPEGDFSEKEIEKARQRGFHFLSLGINRLRVETAALHVASVYHYLLNS